jgi:uncharacterized membrane protein
MDNRINKFVLAGLLGAIITLMTLFISFPIPGVSGAYVNAGDAGVYLAGFLIGGPWGALCAGVGSALADLLIGSAIYALPTFLIKGAVAYLASVMLKRTKGFLRLFALLVPGLLIPSGYFLYECLIYGFATALISVPLNLLQLAGGAVIGFLLIGALGRILKK